MLVGQTIGSYTILAKLGEGGMGEVYHGRDTRLNRDVALKILPATFAIDPDRVARFEREAQLLAALNHPGIAAIYGVELSEGAPVLVLELVEGVTLADRLAAGPLPLDDALPLARQLATALEAAHERGVIHRDLKPANIKITGQRQVKVLDFGLAKMLAPDPASGPLPNSPTMSVHATQAGVILGTAAYMSPEQARGRALDRRTDVWSFGCVLFEMLTGTAPFGGSTVSDSIAAILRSEPDWNLLPRGTPRAIERLLRRCLAKDPALRLRDLGDAQLEIGDALAADTAEMVNAAPTRRATSTRLAWPVGAAVLLSIAVFVLTRSYFAAPPASGPVIQGSIEWPARPGGDPDSRLALSSDGRSLAMVAFRPGEPTSLWLRSLDRPEARELSGTAGARAPFWSPDGRFLAFFADGRLKRLDPAGGAAFTVCECSSRSGTWNSDGVILFSDRNVIVRVPAAGGTPAAVSALDTAAGETVHAYPVFLPDGRHFLYTAFRGVQPRGVYVGLIDSAERSTLVEGAANAAFASGFLIFAKGTALIGQRFDPAGRVLTGDAVPIVERRRTLPNGVVPFTVSQNGSIVFDTRDEAEPSFLWRDRSGKQLGTLGEADAYWDAHLSRDGRYVSVSIGQAGADRELWIFDTERGNRTRFTDDPGSAMGQAWSSDGSRMAFMSTRNGKLDLYEKTVANGQERLLLEGGPQKHVHGWSPDDKLLVYSSGGDLWILPMTGDRKPFPFQQSRFVEGYAQFSTDGRWIAFESDETGRTEVYVAAVPGSSRRLPISKGNGGRQARWRRDGNELFYVGTGQLMSVGLRETPDGLQADTPKPLFDITPQLGGRWRYDVSADGQRFLVGESETGGTPLSSLIVNWQGLVKD